MPLATQRHQSLNDVVSRAFASADIPATKEPSGLVRDDGKRPDGLTLGPWQTVDVGRDNGSHSGRLICEPDFTFNGAAAERAATRKSAKYADLLQFYLFQLIAVETSGSMDSSTATFFYSFGPQNIFIFWRGLRGLLPISTCFCFCSTFQLGPSP